MNNDTTESTDTESTDTESTDTESTDTESFEGIDLKVNLFDGTAEPATTKTISFGSDFTILVECNPDNNSVIVSAGCPPLDEKFTYHGALVDLSEALFDLAEMIAASIPMIGRDPLFTVAYRGQEEAENS